MQRTEDAAGTEADYAIDDAMPVLRPVWIRHEVFGMWSAEVMNLFAPHIFIVDYGPHRILNTFAWPVEVFYSPHFFGWGMMR